MLSCFLFWLAHLRAYNKQRREEDTSQLLLWFEGFFLTLDVLPYKVGLHFAPQAWCMQTTGIAYPEPFDPHETGLFFLAWFVDAAFSSDDKGWQWTKGNSSLFIHSTSPELLLCVQDYKQLL